MAGKATVNQLQLGDSATATQNFVLQTNVDGSAKLARGNAGATTQDVLTVDANGNLKPGVLGNYASDSAAATAGVPIGGLYQTSGTVKVRVV